MQSFLPALPTIVSLLLLSRLISCTTLPDGDGGLYEDRHIVRTLVTFERSLVDSLILVGANECRPEWAYLDSGEIASPIDYLIFDRHGHILEHHTAGGGEFWPLNLFPDLKRPYDLLTRRYFRYTDLAGDDTEHRLASIYEYVGRAAPGSIPVGRFEFEGDSMLATVYEMEYGTLGEGVMDVCHMDVSEYGIGWTQRAYHHEPFNNGTSVREIYSRLDDNGNKGADTIIRHYASKERKRLVAVSGECDRSIERMNWRPGPIDSVVSYRCRGRYAGRTRAVYDSGSGGEMVMEDAQDRELIRARYNSLGNPVHVVISRSALSMWGLPFLPPDELMLPAAGPFERMYLREGTEQLLRREYHYSYFDQEPMRVRRRS